MEKHKIWYGFLSIVFVLSSCSQFIHSSPIEPLPKELAQPLITTIETLEAYSTPLSVEDVQEQVTDGKMLFIIEILEPRCYKPGEFISFRLIFRNLTNQDLRLSNQFNLNNNGYLGEIRIIIHTPSNQSMPDLSAVARIDYVINTPTKDHIEIPSSQEHVFVLEYPFPIEYIDLAGSIAQNETKFITPAPGKYFIRFIYENYSEPEVWNGVISSNQLEVCIIN